MQLENVNKYIEQPTIEEESNQERYVYTVSGNGYPGFYGNNVDANIVKLYYPFGLFLDSSNIFIQLIL